MFADDITVTDGTTPATYSRISQNKMDSVRAHTTAAPADARKLEIKHTIGTNGSSKDRHLVSLTGSETVDGITSQRTINFTIASNKGATAAAISQDVAYLLNFLTPANVAKLLLGGN